MHLCPAEQPLFRLCLSHWIAMTNLYRTISSKQSILQWLPNDIFKKFSNYQSKQPMPHDSFTLHKKTMEVDRKYVTLVTQSFQHVLSIFLRYYVIHKSLSSIYRHREINRSRSSTSEFNGGPMKTLIVPVLLSGKKFLWGAPLWVLLCWKTYIRSSKSFGGPVKLGFSMWRSTSFPKVCIYGYEAIAKCHEIDDPCMEKLYFHTSKQIRTCNLCNHQIHFFTFN